MAVSGVSGLAIAMMGGGVLFAWSAVTGAGVLSNLKGLLHGTPPGSTDASPIDTPTGSASSSTGTTAAPDTTGMPSGTAKTNQAIGRALAAPYGWATGQQWTDLVALWNRESGWNNKAKNPSSGAYGIVQALPPSKLPPAGQESGGSSASAQIAWGLGYIKSRYGDPVGAWAHEQSAGWY